MRRDWNYRQHHALRKQRHAYRIITQCWNMNQYIEDDDTWLMARKLRDNLAVCSCQQCRNPRHSNWLSNEEKLTVQERKAYLDFDFS